MVAFLSDKKFGGDLEQRKGAATENDTLVVSNDSGLSRRGPALFQKALGN